MKTTIDIPDSVLKEVLANTGAKTKRQAILTAVSEYNKRRRLARLAERLGSFEGFISNEELEKLRETAA
jgi:Arc/MetJ family transcription regulator